VGLQGAFLPLFITDFAFAFAVPRGLTTVKASHLCFEGRSKKKKEKNELSVKQVPQDRCTVVMRHLVSTVAVLCFYCLIFYAFFLLVLFCFLSLCVRLFSELIQPSKKKKHSLIFSVLFSSTHRNNFDKARVS
jgi:hypothetical protein